ncbi:unnamed protein product, partial [Mesorhabditis belari]|uniref:Uncharacterized protein n=1 Tax=Mesorhabditis belari TaxID=2138241 RepID=A0AAF3EPQ7_9BILA
MILIVYASAIPIHYSSSEQELTRFEREIKGSDELTETPETDVDRRKREADEHKEHEGEGMEGPPQIDVRDKRRIKQPTGPATTTAITIAEHHQTLTEEKRSAEHERQENHEMKGGPSEQETEDHHVKKRSDSSNEEEEITNHSIGDCEERIDAETDSQNISEPTIEETQTQEDSLPPEESLLEIEPGRGLEAVVVHD